MLRVVGRGAIQIDEAAKEAKIAATRNGHKEDYRRPSLKFWDTKLREEVDELYEAILQGNESRIREELGDVVWSATALVDHDYILTPESEWRDERETLESKVERLLRRIGRKLTTYSDTRKKRRLIGLFASVLLIRRGK